MTFREHHLYHERTLDQQILDTLLRIEEILLAARPAANVKDTPEPQAEEPTSPQAEEPASTQASAKPAAPKGKRKFG